MDKLQKINFGEKVAEARVNQIIQEEEALLESSEEIKTLKQQTDINLAKMEEAAKAEDEVLRRELRNEVVVDNMRLVTHVLKKYGYFSPDKFQNGCVGLLKAADTFETAKGVPFSNYAAFCIEMEIRAAFRKQSRKFESKAAGYLDSIDASVSTDEGAVDKHEAISDPYSEVEFESLVEEAELDTLFYDIIIPAVREYGTRGKDIDMEKWQELTIQYIIEMSSEDSQRQRITLTEMARQLGSTTQNLRTRHKKVMQAIRKRCEDYGYRTIVTPTGRTRFYLDEKEHDAKLAESTASYRGKKHKKGRY